ncbi:hypothetical protein V8068_001203 [Vibrio parahaemolyticus]
MAVQRSREKTTLPVVPKVKVSDPNLQRFCDTVTQFCSIHMGTVGSGLDRAVTVREMVKSGFASMKSNNLIGSSVGGGGGATIIPKPTDPEYPVEKPTQPTGFKVISGTVAIMLIWDDVNFKGAGSTIIYRASSDDFSTAVVLAETPAAVYSDITDNSDEYFYWIRHQNINGDQGALNDASGTPGQAGLLTTNPDGDMMIASELVAFAIYATELTAVHIKGGDMDFAGGRFTVDVNGNCTASSLTINAGGYCRSSTFVSGTQGWAIYGDGSVEFNDGVFRGTVYATDGVFNGIVYAEDGYFKGTVYADKIVGDIVGMREYTIANTSSSGKVTVDLLFDGQINIAESTTVRYADLRFGLQWDADYPNILYGHFQLVLNDVVVWRSQTFNSTGDNNQDFTAFFQVPPEQSVLKLQVVHDVDGGFSVSQKNPLVIYIARETSILS